MISAFIKELAKCVSVSEPLSLEVCNFSFYLNTKPKLLSNIAA